MMLESRDDESKAVARDFIRYVKLKEVLKKQFYVYNQLNSSYVKDKDSARIFVSETLSILDKFSFEDILSYNHLLETRFNVDKIDTTPMDMAISKVIKYRTSYEKTDQAGYIDALNTIIEHVSTYREIENKLSGLNESIANSQLKFLQPKHVIRIALKKFNDRYTSNFDDEDRVIFNALREGDNQKLFSLYDEKVEKIYEISESIKKDIGQELSEKMEIAIGRISTGYTQSNLLDAHELASELERLKK